MSEEGLYELVPQKLYRLGGVAENDGYISWVPASASGFSAFNCYLVTGSEFGLLIGTGPAAFATQTVSAVKRLTAGKKLFLVFLRNEPEVLGALSRLLGEITPEAYYYLGGGGLLEWIEDPRPMSRRTIPLRDTVPMRLPAPERPIPIDEGRGLEFLIAPFRIMGHYWVFDTGTGSLFTEDMFAHNSVSSFDTPVPLTTDDGTTVETVMDYLLMRADWLAGGRTAPIRDAIAEVFENRSVDNICPARGRPIIGPALVRRHVALVLKALDRCAGLEPVGLL